MSLNTYIIEGGIGKCLSFTSLLPRLVEQAGEPVQIVTPYIDIFAGNPLVKMCYDEGSIPLDDPRILESDNIYYGEPYKSNFVKGDEHLIESYCKLFDIKPDKSMKPVMYTDHLKDTARKWLSQVGITGKYIMVQFSGGQSPLNFNNQNSYTSSNAGRNYPQYFAQGIINSLKEIYPDCTIIDATLPNEPFYQNTIKCDQPYPVIHELLKSAQGFISIDSCLQHFAASVNKPGVVIWGNTRWTQFGWQHHKNMSFHDKNKYNTYYKMDINDPRNLLVDPNDVIETYVNYVHSKTVNEKDVRYAHR